MEGGREGGREASSTDFVCVTPNARAQAAYDNGQASARSRVAAPTALTRAYRATSGARHLPETTCA